MLTAEQKFFLQMLAEHLQGKDSALPLSRKGTENSEEAAEDEEKDAAEKAEERAAEDDEKDAAEDDEKDAAEKAEEKAAEDEEKDAAEKAEERAAEDDEKDAAEKAEERAAEDDEKDAAGERAEKAAENTIENAAEGDSEEHSGLSLKSLAELAAEQELSGVLYYQTMEQLNAYTAETENDDAAGTVKNSLERAYNASCFYYYTRIRLLQELKEVFQRESIPFVLLKGAVLAESYPCPMLRTMGDADILIRPEDAEKAGTALEGCGYTATGTESHEWSFEKEGMELELHDGLLHEVYEAYDPNTDAERRFSDTIWEHVIEREDGTFALDETYHFIFLLIHLKTHFLSAGVGFRQFVDILVAAKHWKIDYSLAEGLLEELGLLRFGQVCMGLCARWFGTEMPSLTDTGGENGAEGETVTEAFAEEMAEKLFRGGVFGFADEEYKTKQILLERHLNDAKSDSGANSAGFKLRRFFPSYEYMAMGEHNSFLRGRKWLLPAAWIYRFYRGLTNQAGQKMDDYVSNTFLPEDQVQKNENLMRELGL